MKRSLTVQSSWENGLRAGGGGKRHRGVWGQGDPKKPKTVSQNKKPLLLNIKHLSLNHNALAEVIILPGRN